MADTYSLTFNWPHSDPQSVIVTGTFDNWSSSVHLQRTDTGFSGPVAVPWDSKILYKFIVDGNWVTHPNQPTETDGSGFVNNVIHTPTKPAPVPQPAEPEVAEAKKDTVDEEHSKKTDKAPVEVASNKPVPIQSVVDSTTDTTREAISVPAVAEASTHEAAPPPTLTTAQEPEPTPALETAQEPAPAAAPEPSTPPQKKADLPAPVTPIKTNGTSTGHGHARSSTGTSSPPSSSAPSTPKTHTTFPVIEGETTGSPDSTGGKRKKRLSLIDRVRSVLGSPRGKGKKEARSASPSPKKGAK